MTKLCVNCQSYTEVVRERDYNDRWSGEDTVSNHDIDSIYVSKEENYYDLNVGFDVEEGSTYYLLYGLYSTGDSFNHDSGRLQYVDLYQTEEMAEANKKILENHYNVKGSEDDYTAKLLLDDGREYPFHVPWKGYFERLENLVIEPVKVVSGRMRTRGGGFYY